MGEKGEKLAQTREEVHRLQGVSAVWEADSGAVLENTFDLSTMSCNIDYALEGEFASYSNCACTMLCFVSV